MDYPKATKILHEYAYGNDERMLGLYWSQPGRSKVENKLRDIEPPLDEWEDVLVIFSNYSISNSSHSLSYEICLITKKALGLVSSLRSDCKRDILTRSLFRQRIEYQPGTDGPKTGEGTMLLSRRMMIGECMDFVRTWSSYSAWQDRFQTKKHCEGGEGDIVDEMFNKMKFAEVDWQKDEVWMEKEVEIEWGTGLLLARKR